MEELNKEVEQVKKDTQTLTDEFLKRHITITTDGEDKEISKTYNPITADRELFARMCNIIDTIQEITNALSFLAQEYEKKNDPNRIITKEDSEFHQTKPLDLNG